MTSDNSDNRGLFIQHIEDRRRNFLVRIEEVKRMLKAKDALLTVESLNSFTKKRLKQTIRVAEITRLARYSLSSPGSEFKTGPLNESAVLLLSAYLEGFIEDLYEECLKHLLHENFSSAKVLDVMTYEMRRQFRNPKSGDVGGLFRRLTLDIASNFGPEFKCDDINDLVEARNRIAHGSDEEVSNEKIDEYLLCVRDFANEITREVGREVAMLA